MISSTIDVRGFNAKELVRFFAGLLVKIPRLQ
jgi:hypothetical protein